MNGRHRSVRRSPREWIIRSGLAGLAAVLGYFSVSFSLAQSVMALQPALAHQLASYDGRITARLASSLIDGEPSHAERARADQFARVALRREPTAVIAVSTLGINAEARGDKEAAQRLFAYAFALSRRDPKTQLWQIEDAAARGDVPGALHHYDIALRTRPELAALLYPILTAANADPVIRSALAKTLAGEPRWDVSFINYASRNASDPGLAAQILVDLQRARVTVPAGAQTAVVDALAGASRFDDAWRYYVTIRRGVVRQRSRDPRFTANLETPSVFDWVPVNDGGIAASARDGAFDFSVPASVGGVLLRQVQLLSPGTYRISGRSSGIADEAPARPYWTLQCRADRRELGRVVLPNSAQADGRFVGTFSLPVGGCPVQILALVAPATAAIGGLTARIEQAALVPAG